MPSLQTGAVPSSQSSVNCRSLLRYRTGRRHRTSRLPLLHRLHHRCWQWITTVNRAVNAVVTDWCCSVLTIFGQTAGLFSVTELAVVTERVVCLYCTGSITVVGKWITTVNRAVNAVVTDWCCSCPDNLRSDCRSLLHYRTDRRYRTSRLPLLHRLHHRCWQVDHNCQSCSQCRRYRLVLFRS